MRAPLAICVMLAACGRIGFTPGGPAGDGGAATDGSVGPGASACDGEFATRLFCDGFEHGTALWTPQTRGANTIGVDTTRAYRGNFSLHAYAVTPDAPAWLIASPLSSTAGDLYLREYLYVPGTFATQTSFANVVDFKPPYGGIIAELNADRTVFLNNTITNTLSDSSTIAVPADRWTCIALHISIDATGGSADLAIDGIAAVRTGLQNTLPPDGYRDVHAGVYLETGQSAPAEVWIDELVADTAPIPCD